MIPPTPTALPPATPYFDAFRSFTAWQTTDAAVQSWNMLGDGRYVIQGVILIAVIVAGVYVVMRFAKDFTKRDSEE